MKPCAIEGCWRPERCRGWCNTHYERWRRKGDPGGLEDGRSRPQLPCAIEDCDRLARVRGWCGKHYASWRNTGDPVARIRPNYGNREPYEMQNGYLGVWMPEHPVARKGWATVHRIVAYDAGLLTDLSLHVHHINGDKHDNRVENLEVISATEHARQHARERGTITNQFGTFPLRELRAS